ncbi:hypothetical protein H2199_000504 [Coniosporium tulheliwenetii]|uniref:Uncharacterized protein n=1 Tax=Coniosporium tulheliwenetii TaxID=3383036 RepID=A0ACC2ZQ79_9PEZI|nr:hypothetical protein H2199_000504 [Cladosporium sp. JES 115]
MRILWNTVRPLRGHELVEWQEDQRFSVPPEIGNNVTTICSCPPALSKWNEVWPSFLASLLVALIVNVLSDTFGAWLNRETNVWLDKWGTPTPGPAFFKYKGVKGTYESDDDRHSIS